MSAFDRVWGLLKEGEPVVEFGGNDICPKCGEKMRQRKAQLGFGFPVVHGWGCSTCRSFTPHDPEYAKTPLPKRAECTRCDGTGESQEVNPRTGYYECHRCDGSGYAD